MLLADLLTSSTAITFKSVACTVVPHRAQTQNNQAGSLPANLFFCAFNLRRSNRDMREMEASNVSRHSAPREDTTNTVPLAVLS
jgi:hypothetical protein